MSKRPEWQGYWIDPRFSPGHTFNSHEELVKALKTNRVKAAYVTYCRDLAAFLRSVPPRERKPWESSFLAAVFSDAVETRG